MNLKELSTHLGLSQTTVSRALNGYPEVSEATRKRVMDAANAANYSPSNQARSLATGRAMAIGHVLPVSHQHEMVNPVFGDFISGAGEIYAAAGYEMVLRLAPDGQEEAIYRSLKAKKSVDGIVIHGPRMADPRIGLLTELDLPFVVHGRASDVDLPYSWTDVPNRSAFRNATQHLIDLGHSRIALINGVEQMDFAHRRRQGYTDALEAAGLPVNARWMLNADMTESFGYETTRDLLALPHPPTAFIVSSLIMALGVERAIREAGMEMGRDASVVTWDDALSYLANGTADRAVFTCMRSSVRAAGRHVARMLLDQIENPLLAEQDHMMPVDFCLGGSTGPAPS